MMGFIQSQNLTQPEVTHWESTAHLSAVNNTIVVLGVLTFALQLCLVLFVMLRCWRLDSRVREALKHPQTASKLHAPSSFHIYKQASYRFCDNDAAASSPVVSETADDYKSIMNPLFAPSIPWDLVQR